MKPLNKFSSDFFDKYKDKPVNLKPYSQDMRELADKYLGEIRSLLQGGLYEAALIGSVAYRIPTADVEIAVYADKENWDEILNILEGRYGRPTNREAEFARFEIPGEEYEMDIHVYSGYEGEVSKKLTKFILENPDLIEKYYGLKEKFSFSRKEYQRQKNDFLNNVIQKIPDDYG